ncbi:M24 family metallopeptidase [Actinomadura welshii]|uniref:M24 family metallopeptidase n=1 Tax=Actinomadura welshii TaxID=3103817 RepID=UPI0003AD19CF|nr:Xaa-Pro peptidase family protein [Actinomadura madurae]
MTAELTIAVPQDEHRTRTGRLRQVMRRRGLAAVALTSPENLYYLLGLDHLGYFAFTMAVVPLDGPPVLVARRMERHTLTAQVPSARQALYGETQDPAKAAARVLASVTPPGSAIGVEEGSMTLPPAVLARLRQALPDRTYTDCTALPARLRTVKSASEIDLVRWAADISGTAMHAALDAAGTGVSERTVAARAQWAMTSAGGHQPGFTPLVRSLDRLAQEHVTWREHHLRHGEGLFVELSGCVHRYHAPMSRTVYCGEAPPDAAEAASAASAALEAARAALVPGNLTGDVYAAWAGTVAAATGRRPRRHHCGYLTGIGFPPSWVGGASVPGIRAGGRTRIREGMVFHLMSWIDRPGHVVSDTALVEANGAVLLTDAPRSLIVRP